MFAGRNHVGDAKAARPWNYRASGLGYAVGELEWGADGSAINSQPACKSVCRSEAPTAL